MLNSLLSLSAGWNLRLVKQDAAFSNLLISFWTDPCGLIVFGAVNIRTVVKGAIPAADRAAATLVDKVPVEACIGPVLSTFVLYK